MALPRVIHSTFIFGGWTVLSRIFGLARDMLMAATLGASAINDVFIITQQFPNLFRSLFAEGAFTNAFAPQYSYLLKKYGLEDAKKFAGHLIAVMLLAITCLCALVMYWMPEILSVLVPGFTQDHERFSLSVLMSRITMPYLICMVIMAFLAGILNAHGYYSAHGAVPIVLNICLIIVLLSFIIGLHPVDGPLLAISIIIAGLLQLIILLSAAYRIGLLPSISFRGDYKLLGSVLKRTGPGVIGAVSIQASVLVANYLASTLEIGSISWLYYAQRLAQLPLGIVGVAISVSILPVLSKYVAAQNTDEAHKQQNIVLHFALILCLPASTALFIIPEQIISFLFQHGSFTVDDTRATASALSIYGLALPAWVMIKCFLPAFFARFDTKTPMYISIFGTVMMAMLAVALIQDFNHLAMPIASSIAAWCEICVVIYLVRTRYDFTFASYLIQNIGKLFIALVILAAYLWGVSIFLSTIATFIKISILVLGGGLLYIFTLIKFKIMPPYILAIFDNFTKNK